MGERDPVSSRIPRPVRPGRVVIENITPSIDGGRFPIKRTLGETIIVEATVFAEGADFVTAVAKYRCENAPVWWEAEMRPIGNDRWRCEFTISELGRYEYTVEGWINRFGTWHRGFVRKLEAGQDVRNELHAGAEMLNAAAERAAGEDAAMLQRCAVQLLERVESEQVGKWESGKVNDSGSGILDERVTELMEEYANRGVSTIFEPHLKAVVDPVLARFGAWYEMFPRSCIYSNGRRHGTLKDCEAQLPRIARMGFDVLYLPPIHPIGRTHRKGKNNSASKDAVERKPLTPALSQRERENLIQSMGEGEHPPVSSQYLPATADLDTPGSPWAIGGPEGGHKEIHPELGTAIDFRRLVAAAREFGIEIALDIALQCSPDHPYVREHPEWFRHRADGSIQYAENPPKKYQDIYPLDFECEAWESLWQELKSIFEHWIGEGVRIFRVDNPHTKPFAFWEWCIGELKSDHPDLIFLSEAFTRPKVMYRLAKIGFTQSYNYFPWRNTKDELITYMTELNQPPLCDYFRPNLWPNTPDILTEYLQSGGKAAFEIRLILAATLGASYGIYGPAFELCENQPLKPGSEEYLNSEKYEIRKWELNSAGAMPELISRVNKIRRENPALQQNRNLVFHKTDNDQLLAFTKSVASNAQFGDHSARDVENGKVSRWESGKVSDVRSGRLPAAIANGQDTVLVVVNLDPHHTHRGWLELPLEQFGLDANRTYQMHDLLTDARFLWKGPRNFIELDPRYSPAHIFRLRQFARSERDFDYFM